MKGKSGFQIGTGVTSILMIFVVLCLTTFAILSYSSAEAELERIEKHVDYIESYYDAYSRLNDEVAKVDSVVLDMLEDDSDIEYDCETMVQELQEMSTDGITVTYEVLEDTIRVVLMTDINSQQQLKMEVTMNTDDVNKRCIIDKCYVYTENEGFTENEALPDMWGG